MEQFLRTLGDTLWLRFGSVAAEVPPVNGTRPEEIVVEESPIVSDLGQLIEQLKGGATQESAPTTRKLLDKLINT